MNKFTLDNCIRLAEIGFDTKTLGISKYAIPFYRLMHRYTEPHRFYHTITHIEELGKLYFQFCAYNGRTPDRSMCLAILFHDVVYEVANAHAENEADSVEWFKQALLEVGDVPDPILLDEIRLLVFSTDSGLKLPGTLLSDLDFMILAKESEEYQRYSRLIRMEWIKIPDPIYIEARKRFLTSTIDRASNGNLFSLIKSGAFAATLGYGANPAEAAITNMENELHYLSSGRAMPKCLQQS